MQIPWGSPRFNYGWLSRRVERHHRLRDIRRRHGRLRSQTRAWRPSLGFWIPVPFILAGLLALQIQIAVGAEHSLSLIARDTSLQLIVAVSAGIFALAVPILLSIFERHDALTSRAIAEPMCVEQLVWLSGGTAIVALVTPLVSGLPSLQEWMGIAATLSAIFLIVATMRALLHLVRAMSSDVSLGRLLGQLVRFEFESWVLESRYNILFVARRDAVLRAYLRARKLREIAIEHPLVWHKDSPARAFRRVDGPPLELQRGYLDVRLSALPKVARRLSATRQELRMPRHSESVARTSAPTRSIVGWLWSGKDTPEDVPGLRRIVRPRPDRFLEPQLDDPDRAVARARDAAGSLLRRRDLGGLYVFYEHVLDSLVSLEELVDRYREKDALVVADPWRDLGDLAVRVLADAIVMAKAEPVPDALERAVVRLSHIYDRCVARAASVDRARALVILLHNIPTLESSIHGLWSGDDEYHGYAFTITHPTSLLDRLLEDGKVEIAGRSANRFHRALVSWRGATGDSAIRSRVDEALAELTFWIAARTELWGGELAYATALARGLMHIGRLARGGDYAGLGVMFEQVGLNAHLEWPQVAQLPSLIERLVAIVESSNRQDFDAFSVTQWTSRDPITGSRSGSGSGYDGYGELMYGVAMILSRVWGVDHEAVALAARRARCTDQLSQALGDIIGRAAIFRDNQLWLTEPERVRQAIERLPSRDAWAGDLPRHP